MKLILIYYILITYLNVLDIIKYDNFYNDRLIRFGNIKRLEEFIAMGDLEVVGGIVGDLDFNIGWLGGSSGIGGISPLWWMCRYWLIRLH